MGLLSRFTGQAAPAKKPTDDVLLLHAMLLMVGVDGVVEAAEMEMLEAYFATLPEFENKDFDDLYADARKLVARAGGAKESVDALRELSSERVRRKCYILAADIAMSSGDVDEAEDQLLETMQRLLEIDDATAARIVEVLSWKYVR